jgi:hypothetical protein
MRGGARKGAGRKPGKKNAAAVFSLSFETIAALAAIPSGQRSKFVQAAIAEKLAR